eukprot:TRINITY_DN6236_c0_g2_i3.p1 TRINITY_DN6236_c0_g2~~TRINITY_DN6236_c0_g2_i3.p1  ORF type:complete len:315 (+),score=85.51 TRINITY_DN6236_c0_g2_i3:73-945(+)
MCIRDRYQRRVHGDSILNIMSKLVSFITKPIRDAFQRLSEWTHPPGVRWYKSPYPKARTWRFPAPGSEPVDYEFNSMSYKTAYRDSVHSVRYIDEEPGNGRDTWVFIHDPFGESVEQKLVRFGYLEQNAISNTSAVEKAKAQYEKEIGESADVRLHNDDLGIAGYTLEKKGGRQEIANFVSDMFAWQADVNEIQGYSNDLDQLYHAQFYYMKTFDYAADDPVYRQLLLDVEWTLEGIEKTRLDIGKMPVYKADPKYWQVLDDSFTAENISKVQTIIRDNKGYILSFLTYD